MTWLITDMLASVRTPAWFLVLIAGCHPSATVENTMPVANLQTYGTVALRVHSTTFASQGQAMFLEAAVLDKVRRQCGFEQVGRPGSTPADVVLDLNITNRGRGGGGLISNNNLATIDTLLVLSDGTRHPCVVQRRKGTQLGVKFLLNEPSSA